MIFRYINLINQTLARGLAVLVIATIFAYNLFVNLSSTIKENRAGLEDYFNIAKNKSPDEVYKYIMNNRVLYAHNWYNIYSAINQITEEDSTILVPPRDDSIFPIFGNYGLLRFFLYPRGFNQTGFYDINEKYIDQKEKIMASGSDYLLIVDDPHGIKPVKWPEIPISGYDVYIVDSETGKVEYFGKTYDPAKFPSNYGVIKLKH